MLRRVRGAVLRALLPSAFLLALGAAPAAAGTIPPPLFPCTSGNGECFDELPSGSDVAAADLDGLDVSTALVLSEGDAQALTGFDTSGWATSGDQGLLNTLAPGIDFTFDVPVVSFFADVLSLPGPEGDPLPVVLQAWSGDTLVGIDVSNVARIGDSGRPEDTLSAFDDMGITRVSLFAGVACDGMLCFDKGPTTSFWVDTVAFEPIPEPATALLLAGGLAALGLRRRS